MILGEVHQNSRKGRLGGIPAHGDGSQLDGPLEAQHGDLDHRQVLAWGGQFREALTGLDVVLRVHALGPQPEAAARVRTLQAEDALGEDFNGLNELLAWDRHGPLALTLSRDSGFEGQFHVCGLQDHFLGSHVHEDVLKDGQSHPPVEGVLQEPQRPIQTIFGNL